MSRAQLREIRSESGLGPWRGKVTISAMVGRAAGRATSLPHETLFQVTAEWLGPPPVFSMHPPTETVQAQDSAIVTTYIGALRTAKAAADHLRHGQVPDIRKLAGAESAGVIAPARSFG